MGISIVMISDKFARNHTPEGYAKDIVDLLRGIMETDPDFLNLFFEGFAVAQQSQVVREQLSSLYGQFHNSQEMDLRRARDKGIIHPSLPLEALAAIITGLVDGMGLQLLTKPMLCQNQVIWDSIETSIVDLLCDNR